MTLLAPNHSLDASSLLIGKGILLLGVLFLAAFLGMAAAVVDGLIIAVMFAMLASTLLVLADYRIGIWLLVFMLPFAATQLIPRQMFGVVGLNPVNVLLTVTCLGMMAAVFFSRQGPRLVALPKPLLIYLALIVFAAAMGSFHATSALPQLSPEGHFAPLTKTKYLLDSLFKPLIIIVIAWLAACHVRNNPAKSLVAAVAVSALIYCLLIFGFLALSGISLDILASSRARGFLSWMGMHANELGLMTNMMFALLLFSGLGMRRGFMRLLLLSCAAAAAVTAALTFSRGAFLGILVVAAYFLLTRRRFGQLGLGLAVLLAAAFLLPEAFVERATTGLDRADLGAISAGRVDGIWRPLWPLVWDRPLLGHGLSSTLWAEPNLRGGMLPVGHPHSAYLGVLLDFGLIGAAIVIAFFASMWRLFRQLKKTHPDPFWRGLFEGGAVCLLLLLVQGLTDDRFVPTYPQSLLWLTYGLALGHASLLGKNAVP